MKRRFSRRSVLRGLALGGAAGAFGATLPGLRYRRAHAIDAGQVYPTIFIHLRGGLDIAMHFDARTGYANRNVQAADIMETAAGVRWYQPTLADLAVHMEDCCLIRNVEMSNSHSGGYGFLWYGEDREDDAAGAVSWTNYLASQLIATQTAAAPNLVTFDPLDDAPITDYTGFSNSSPNPLAAAQRVRGLQDFSNGLDVLSGQPDPAIQARVFSAIDAMDARNYSPIVQARAAQSFAAANSQATELLSQPVPPVWPPSQEVRDLFNLSDDDLTRIVNDGNQRIQSHLALAFSMAQGQLSHVMHIASTQGGYDTHQNNDSRQRSSSATNFPAIGRLLSALKATQSPVDPAVSMFDTTHVIVTSELSRANRVDTGEDLDGTGTPHWPWVQFACFGGSFKRGYGFGGLNENFVGVPADFATGAIGQGEIPTVKNVLATIIKANGVDPSGWASVAPIDAVLTGV